MGGAGPIGPRRGRRALDAVINLVPFIDLLSCCLSFLLITAVWTQLARIEVSQQGPGGATNEEVARPRLSLHISRDAWVISGRGDAQTLAFGDGAEGRLVAALQRMHGPGAEDEITIVPDDQVDYGLLVRTFDAALSAHYQGLSVAND